MPHESTVRKEHFISLAEAIDSFATDLYGPKHPQRDVVARKAKASFTRSQLVSTSREFVLSTMMHLMQSTLAALAQKGRVEIRDLSPLMRSLIEGRADRALVERYLRNVATKP